MRVINNVEKKILFILKTFEETFYECKLKVLNNTDVSKISNIVVFAN